MTVFDRVSRKRGGIGYIECHGGFSNLVLEVRIAAKFQDLSPEVLLRVELPNDKLLVGVRLYDITRSMELRVGPEAEFSKKISGVIWVLPFEDLGSKLKEGKAMARRLENLMREMPDAWFSYRNFSRPEPREYIEGDAASSTPAAFIQTITGGHKWVSTGLLASPEFQHGLGRRLGQDSPEEGRESSATITRSVAKARDTTLEEKPMSAHQVRWIDACAIRTAGVSDVKRKLELWSSRSRQRALTRRMTKIRFRPLCLLNLPRQTRARAKLWSPPLSSSGLKLRQHLKSPSLLAVPWMSFRTRCRR